MASKDLVLSCLSKTKILKWHVKQGEAVKNGQILATYIFTEKVDPDNLIVQRKLKAKFNAKVVELYVKPNDDIPKGNVVARLREEKCKHNNTIMKEMCCSCGADLRKEPGISGQLSEPVVVDQPVVPNIPELVVSKKEAQRLAKKDEKLLLKAKKLVLVVDLDMTLIHTTVHPVPRNTQDVYSFKLPGHQYEYHTKLRPDAHKFLENISKYYELHIFTMGSRMYAHTIAKMLDPDGKYFAHRIRSRDEFINNYSKFHDLKALFPCGDHMVCIIDDREDVWNFAPNLIMVKPYKYFKGSDDINDPFKPNSETTKMSKLETPSKGNGKDNSDASKEKSITTENKKSDDPVADTKKEKNEKVKNGNSSNESNHKRNEKNVKEATPTDNAANTIVTNNNATNNNNHVSLHKDTDDYLYFLGKILERIHGAFYDTLDNVKGKAGLELKNPQIIKYCSFGTADPDVRVIVPELRRQTLIGCNIVFTGVVPTNVPLEKSRPWRTAVELGAKVTEDIIQKKISTEESLCTTHVVAARHGTQKSYKASKSHDIRLVNPNWLWCASERWHRPEESIFPVPLLDGRTSPSGSRQGTPQHNPFEPQQKVRKQVSPLAQEGFELPGGYDPDAFLENVNSLGGFSKGELDAMDKEVEEFMQSENEDSSDDSSNNDDDTPKRSTIRSSSTESRKRKRNVTFKDCPSENNDNNDGKSEEINLLENPNKKMKIKKDSQGATSSRTSSGDDNDEKSEEAKLLKKRKKKMRTKKDSQGSTSSRSSSSSSSGDDNDEKSEEAKLLKKTKNKMKTKKDSQGSTSSRSSSSSSSGDDNDEKSEEAKLLKKTKKKMKTNKDSQEATSSRLSSSSSGDGNDENTEEAKLLKSPKKKMKTNKDSQESTSSRSSSSSYSGDDNDENTEETKMLKKLEKIKTKKDSQESPSSGSSSSWYSGDSSSSSTSSNSPDDDDEDQLGNMLERKISESS